MKKYWVIFKTEFSRLSALHLDFWMGRAVSIVTLFTNYFLWTTVFAARQEVWGYSLEKMIAYTVGVAILYNIVFIHTHERMGWEIVEGTFSAYLVRPVNYFFYAVTVAMGKRILYFISIVITIAALTPFLYHLFVQTNILLLTLSVFAVFLGIALSTFIDFMLGISSFWFHRSFGLRWMMLMLVVMTSGAAFPIDLFPSWLARVLFATPFPYIMFFPLTVYLGRFSASQLTYGFVMSAWWIIALAFLTRCMWKRGLKRFEGVGI